MITLCRIVLTVVSCTIDPATPAPTPAEAVAIFAASAGPSRVPVPDVPFMPGWVNNTPGEPYDPNWPFTGTFAPTWAPTTQRLDGTWLSDPPAVYGAPFGHGYRGHYAPLHEGGRYGGTGRPGRGFAAAGAAPPVAPAPIPAPRLEIHSRPVAQPGAGAVIRRRP